jgi:hypothetical protein
MASDRVFFLKSVEESYARLIIAEKPIQVDLYILVHFLIYQDELQFTSDEKQALGWKKKIVDYFLSTVGKGTWEVEGCLPEKVLIGLHYAKIPQTVLSPIVMSYKKMLDQTWKGKGAGECFSENIVRTYGATAQKLPCSAITEEVEAKFAFYQTLIKNEKWNPLRKVKLKTPNSIPKDPISSFWSMLPHEWVINTYLLPKQKMIGKKRIEKTFQLIEEAISKVNLDAKSPVDKTLAAQLLSSYWKIGGGLNAKTISLLEYILKTETRDEKGIGSVASYANKTHNVQATPAYLKLLAMNEFLKNHKAP